MKRWASIRMVTLKSSGLTALEEKENLRWKAKGDCSKIP